jgi:ubiquinone/menaquinone biosynthesis C-methylase UbiE
MRRIRVMKAVAVMVMAALVETSAAQLGSRSTEEWIKTLDSPNRIAGLRVDEVIARLGLKPGESVVDVGAGTGVFSVALAKAVSPGGTVYAVEVEQGLVDHIGRKAKTENVVNLRPVLGGFTDPNLPASNIDVAFIHDVLHHIEDRAAYLKSLAKYLDGSARIVVIDFHPERGGHRGQPELQVSPEQAAQLMAGAGFKPVQTIDLFEDKYFIVYGRR